MNIGIPRERRPLEYRVGLSPVGVKLLTEAGHACYVEREKQEVSTAPFPPEFCTLRDGTVVTVRPIRPDDAPRLQATFSRLSEESIFLRFLDHRKALPDAEARQLAALDYHSRMALVAVVEEQGQETVIGVARYAVADPTRPDIAEAAVTVEDRFQGWGLGLLLTGRLAAYARSHGITTWLAEVSVENNRMIQFIRRSGLPVKRKLESGVWVLQVSLEGVPPLESSGG
ncbi:MAG: GNAT family N-acetyltransferase [Chloroflexi bacterium]|nr:GNAT family N-acetyltransferase [Chloroflexota bacterium]